MKLRKVLGLVIVSVLACSLAQATPGIEQGKKEVSIFGNWSSPEDADFDTLLLGGRFGYFYTDAIQIGINGLYFGMLGDFDFSSYGLDLDVRYHFLTQLTVVPYVGAEGGLAFLDSEGGSAIGYQVGGGGGVKFFVTEDVNVYAEYKYLYQALQNDGDSADTTTQMVNFGLSLLF